MARSESVRQEVLQRDNTHCQICGKSTDLTVHHIRPLGMGGSEEKDVAENMITLCSECHRKIHAGTLHIESFTSDELIITDGESRRMPDSELWFYQRQRVEELEQAEARLIGLQAIEEAKARDLWELATGDPPGYTLLDGYSEGETFSGYVSGRNISVRLANEAVTAYNWIKNKGL
ncbi:MAG: HNH endonuclease, partial [Methanotrichaceae archaeon]